MLLETIDAQLLNCVYPITPYEQLMQENKDRIIGEKVIYKYDVFLESDIFPNTKTSQRHYEDKLINNGNVLFIGDSRFVGMKKVSDSNYQFFAKTGKGYEWFIQNEKEIQKLIDEDTIIIISLGINDLHNLSLYIDFFSEWNNDNVYFVSVNPINEERCMDYGYELKNADIDKFNEKIKNVFKEKYIDTNSFLKVNGFSTTDGLHYASETYKEIYSYIIDFVADEYWF